MKSLQAAQMLSLSVILTCITSSVFACPCQTKHPQYHYCVSDYVFQALVTEFEEVPKSLLEEPVNKPNHNSPQKPTTTQSTMTQVSTMRNDSTSPETEQINSTTSTDNSSSTVDIESRDVDRWNTTWTTASPATTAPTTEAPTTTSAPTTEKSHSFPKIQFEARQPGRKLISLASSVSIGGSQMIIDPSYDSYPSSSEYLQYPQDYYIRYRVKVTKAFKGIRIGHYEIFTLADLNDCGLRHLRNSTSYLFTVSEGDDGRIYATNCDWVEEYEDLTAEQLTGLRKTYGKYCKDCNNSDDCSNDPWYAECNHKYSSCIRRPQLGCTWAKSTKHRNCRNKKVLDLEYGTPRNAYQG